MGIDKECPWCEGKGKEGFEPGHWDGDQMKWVIGKSLGMEACPFCSAGFNAYYNKAKELEESYSGHARHLDAMKAKDINKAWAGEDGQRYRRLVKWVWEHPKPEEGDVKCGRVEKRKDRSTPFKKLFAFEKRYQRAGNAITTQTIELEENVYMQCIVERKELLGMLKAAMKVVERSTTIPILSCVKLSVGNGEGNGELEIKATDLDKWESYKIKAADTIPGEVCVSARRLYWWIGSQREKWDRFVEIRLYDDNWVELRSNAGRSVCRLVGLDVSSWPRRKWPEREPEVLEPEWKMEYTMEGE